MKLYKINYKKIKKKKELKSIQANLLNIWLKSWDRDKFIRNKKNYEAQFPKKTQCWMLKSRKTIHEIEITLYKKIKKKLQSLILKQPNILWMKLTKKKLKKWRSGCWK
jgi:hypothetical protein